MRSYFQLCGQHPVAEMEREKLADPLVIFTDLKMPRERDAVRAELEKTVTAHRDPINRVVPN
jgi:hypothetical protein